MRPFAHSICFLLRLPAEAACHCSVSMFSPCPRPHGPHLSLRGSGLCQSLLNVPSSCKQCRRFSHSSRPLMRAHWGPVLPSYWMRHSRAQQPSASLTFWRGLPSFQLIRKPAVASLRQSTLRHALVSRLLILLKAAGDSCPILALADEDPWMGWQLVSDVVSGRSESL